MANRRNGGAILAVGLALATLAVVVSWQPPGDSAGSGQERAAAPGSEVRSRVGAQGESDPGPHAVPRDVVPAAPRFLRARCVPADSDAFLENAVWTVEDVDTKARLFTASGPQLAFPLPSGATGTWIVRVGAGQCIPLSCRVRGVADRDLDLGVVRLRRGVSVRGTVRDTKDRPVAGAQVWLRSPRPSCRSGPMLELPPGMCRAGPDGAFVLPHPVASGAYAVDLQDAPQLASAETVSVSTGSPVLEIVCRALDRADQIRGLVRESGGEPAAGVIVDAAPSADGRGYRVATQTRADGTFVLYRPAALAPDEPMFVGMTRSRGGSQHARVRCLWGQPGLELVLRPPQRLRVRVLAADGGEPVRGFAVQCFPMAGAYGFNPMRAESTDHPGGVAHVEGLRAGTFLTVVHPRGESASRFVPTLPFRCEMPEGRDGDIRVMLRERREFPVEVAFRDGAPAVDSVVSLYALHGASRLHGKLFRTDLWRFFQSGGVRGPFAVRVAMARTDADGVARLPWSPSQDSLVVRVEGQHPRHDEHGVKFASNGDRAKVVLDRGGALRGRFVPAESLPLLRTMTEDERSQVQFLARQGFDDKARRFRVRRETGFILVSVDDPARRLPMESRERFPIAADGSFSVEGVPEGGWAVVLERRDRRGLFEEIGPLAEVEVRGAGGVEHEIDLRGFLRPGSITVNVRHNGSAPADAEFAVEWLARGGSRVTAGRARCDATGQFVVEGLLPRRYRLVLRYGPNFLSLGAPVTLPEGGQLTLARSVETRPVRLRFGPKSARKRVVILGESGAGKGLRFRRPIGADGVLDLPFVPPGTYRIEGSSEAPLLVGRGTDRQEFVRSFPPSR